MFDSAKGPQCEEWWAPLLGSHDQQGIKNRKPQAEGHSRSSWTLWAFPSGNQSNPALTCMQRAQRIEGIRLIDDEVFVDFPGDCVLPEKYAWETSPTVKQPKLCLHSMISTRTTRTPIVTSGRTLCLQHSFLITSTPNALLMAFMLNTLATCIGKWGLGNVPQPLCTLQKSLERAQ